MRVILFSTLFLINVHLHCQTKEKVLLIPYHAKSGWGFSDTLANIVIKPQAYDSVDFFDYQGVAKVYKKKKVNAIDSRGELLLKDYCDKIEWYGGEEWRLVNKNLIGLYDPTKRRYVLDVLYDRVDTYEKIRLVTKKKKIALFNLEGKALTEFKFDSIADMFNDYIVAYSGKKLFEVNYDDGKITPVTEIRQSESTGLMFEEVEADMPEDLRRAPQEFIDRITENYGLDSMNATPVMFFRGVEVYQVYAKGKTGYYFWSERLMMQRKYDALFELSYTSQRKYEMIAVLDGRYGVIDEHEKIMVPFEYDKIHSLNASFVYTVKGGKTGVWIFNTIYPPIKNLYDHVKFTDRLNVSRFWSFMVFRVQKGNKWGYVGENGTEYFE